MDTDNVVTVKRRVLHFMIEDKTELRWSSLSRSVQYAFLDEEVKAESLNHNNHRKIPRIILAAFTDCLPLAYDKGKLMAQLSF